MVRRTKEEAEQTRKDILQASLNMFCEKGYNKTTLDDIAKSINLTKGAIYWYFDNKPAILKAIMVEDFENISKQLASYIPTLQNIEDLKKYYMFLAEKVDTDINFRKFLYFIFLQMEWSTGLINSFQDIIEELSMTPIITIEKVLLASQKCGQITSNLDVKVAASTIHAMWVGLLFNKLHHQQNSLGCMVNYSFDLVLNALLSRKD